jgi:hypothetical protein
VAKRGSLKIKSSTAAAGIEVTSRSQASISASPTNSNDPGTILYFS